MKIEKVHCLFEQSGTFKTAFKNLGYEAFDYDIQNNFGQTDNVIDLFHEIEEGFDYRPSIFDKIGGGDLMLAFFPCIYFESMSMMYFDMSSLNLKNKSISEKYHEVVERIASREKFLTILYKLCGIAEMRGLRLIIENPASNPHYLLFPQNFIKKPSLIDKNRALRGDFYKKPTAYWYFNCEPTYGRSFNPNPHPKRITDAKSAPTAGLCSEERSLISPEYAKNFICDFILGIPNENTERNLFDTKP